MALSFTVESLSTPTEGLENYEPPHSCELQTSKCKKTCGSIGCKRDIKNQSCVGIIQDRCTATSRLSETDLQKATAWINGKDGDLLWLFKKDTRGTGAPIVKNRQYRRPNLQDPFLSHLAGGRITIE